METRAFAAETRTGVQCFLRTSDMVDGQKACSVDAGPGDMDGSFLRSPLLRVLFKLDGFRETKGNTDSNSYKCTCAMVKTHVGHGQNS